MAIETTVQRPNLYRCHYNGKAMDVPETSTYRAQEVAAKIWRTKGYKVATVLVGKGYDRETETVSEIVGLDPASL